MRLLIKMTAKKAPSATVNNGDGPDDHHQSLSAFRSHEVLAAETVYRFIRTNWAAVTLGINAQISNAASPNESRFNLSRLFELSTNTKPKEMATCILVRKVHQFGTRRYWVQALGEKSELTISQKQQVLEGVPRFVTPTSTKRQRWIKPQERQAGHPSIGVADPCCEITEVELNHSRQIVHCVIGRKESRSFFDQAIFESTDYLTILPNQKYRPAD